VWWGAAAAIQRKASVNVEGMVVAKKLKEEQATLQATPETIR